MGKVNSSLLIDFQVFDESDTAWHMHLEGARSIYDLIPEKTKSAADFEFLKPWFQYHYVLSEYTYPAERGNTDVFLPCDTPENYKVRHPYIMGTHTLHR